MPLTLLVPIVAVGLALIALALWAMGFGAAAPLDNDAISRAIDREFDTAPSSVLISPDGRAALAKTPIGPLIAWRMGGDVALRRAEHADVKASQDGITFRFDDFAAPPLAVNLPKQARADWETILS